MNTKEIVKQIEKIDPSSEDGWKIYKAALLMFFGRPYQEGKGMTEQYPARREMAIQSVSADYPRVYLALALSGSAMSVVEGKYPSSSGQFEIDGKKFYFNFYDKPESLDKLGEMLKNNIVVKGGKGENSDKTNK